MPNRYLRGRPKRSHMRRSLENSSSLDSPASSSIGSLRIGKSRPTGKPLQSPSRDTWEPKESSSLKEPSKTLYASGLDRRKNPRGTSRVNFWPLWRFYKRAARVGFLILLIAGACKVIALL